MKNFSTLSHVASREEDVQELMAKSRIDAVVGRIPDEAVRTELMQKLHPEEF